MTVPLLGAIADDMTGATDLASMLVRHGMRAEQRIGVPGASASPPRAEAVIVALKSRTAPVAEAVAESRAALAWLARAGARHFFFKVCSTFDSTDQGNIGPVADALLSDLSSPWAPVTPAFPRNGRTVYRGHLFVGNALLSESGMEHHPLTPMRDSNLVRVLGRQTDGRVGLVGYDEVAQGARAIRAAAGRLSEAGHRYVVLDATTDAHLADAGHALADRPLLVGGSGLALGLPAAWRAQGLLEEQDEPGLLPDAGGGAAVLAGSASRATNAQLGFARDHLPTWVLDPLSAPDAGALADAALVWASTQAIGPGAPPLLIAATAPPERVQHVQALLGAERAGALIERALGRIARGLVERGVRRMVVAGGETSGAVLAALGIERLAIGPEIDPGVPWTWSATPAPGLHLALKSGNFGARDFFLRAFEVLPGLR